jgi:cytochrome c-type biogenesis protein CcmH/NrfG
MTAPEAAAEAGERWSLVDRRDFLRRSLEDADREHEAGDLDDTDYELLRRRDEARLGEVEVRLDALDARPASAPARVPGAGAPGARRRLRRPRRRAWLGVVGTLAVIAGAVVLVASLTSTRLPGQVATGDVRLTAAKLIDQQLDQAAVLVGEGDVVEALQLYREVLAKSPHQSTALAEAGWLEWESGSGAGKASLEAKGRESVAEAVRVAPNFYAGHLYLGTIDLKQGDDPAAVAQYRLFLSDDPPADWTRDYSPEIRAAFSAAGQPLPAGVPAK